MYACSFLLNTCISLFPLNPSILDRPFLSVDIFKKFDTTDTLSVNKFSCISMSSTTSPIPADKTIIGIFFLNNLLNASVLPSLKKKLQIFQFKKNIIYVILYILLLLVISIIINYNTYTLCIIKAETI